MGRLSDVICWVGVLRDGGADSILLVALSYEKVKPVRIGNVLYISIVQAKRSVEIEQFKNPVQELFRSTLTLCLEILF